MLKYTPLASQTRLRCEALGIFFQKYCVESHQCTLWKRCDKQNSMKETLTWEAVGAPKHTISYVSYHTQQFDIAYNLVIITI